MASISNGTVQVSIPQFLGINQSVGEQLGLKYASHAENFNTKNGKLAVASGFTAAGATAPAPILTLASFYRRFHATESERTVLVAATATSVYVRVGDDDEWTEVYAEAGSGKWSCVAYEDYRDGATTPTDVLLMSNAVDGMIALWGDDLTTVATVTTPAKFGTLARYKERIFGTSATDEPDRIWYSAPFDPTDWDVNLSSPEMGGGFIDTPTWDGDSFLALQPFGNYLICFKKRSAFLLTGADPGEYVMNPAMGSFGPVATGSICSTENAVFFVGTDGIGYFNGEAVKILTRDALCTFWATINTAAIGTSISAVYKNVYYAAVPTGDSTVPDAIIEYDMERNTFMLRTGFDVGSLLNDTTRLLITTASTPDTVCEWGVGDTYNGVAIDAVWMSAWQDLGAPDAIKESFLLRGSGSGHAAGSTSLPGSGVFIIETERRSGYTTVPFPVLASTPYLFKKPIFRTGILFRLTIENESGDYFQLDKGLTIDTYLEYMRGM